MKKKLESELISIAHRILQLKGKEDVIKMHEEVTILFEKLSVLKFAHENYEEDAPSIGNDSSFFGMLDNAFNNKLSDTIEVEDKIYINLDDVEEDDIMEPGMKTIRDMVEHMPKDDDNLVSTLKTSKNRPSENLEDLTAGFENLPDFEPVIDVNKIEDNKPKSLNDKFKANTLKIGLNDKLAFVKQLFDGKNEDYERVISQINTTRNFAEASKLIQDVVKPDYNHWIGKEEVEERFMEIIESKFSS